MSATEHAAGVDLMLAKLVGVDELRKAIGILADEAPVYGSFIAQPSGH